MNWYACNDGRLINLDLVTDIEPSTVYRPAGKTFLSITFQTGDEEIAGAWLNLAGGGYDGRFLLIDADDLARMRALFTNGGAT